MELARAVRGVVKAISALLESLLSQLSGSKDGLVMGDESDWDSMYTDFRNMSWAVNDLSAGEHFCCRQQLCTLWKLYIALENASRMAAVGVITC